MPFVYIVECVDGSLYTGWAKDVQARLEAHNAGRGARYTRTRRPVSLVYVEERPTRAEAMKRERQIKRCSHLEKLQLAAGAGGQVERIGQEVVV